MNLGLTGGIGCGKSQAARAFVARGFRPIDSDALMREEILTRPEIVRAVRDRFGEAVTDSSGAIDRRELAGRVFADDGELRWLEGLTHPVLFELWRRELGAEPQANRIFEVPLLFERALENWFDFTVCVTCSPSQQLVRLEQRGLPRGLAEQRISKQLPLARKIELADLVLWNDGSAAFLQLQVDRLVDSLPGQS
jgi:dephospho-CoA kinase